MTSDTTRARPNSRTGTGPEPASSRLRARPQAYLGAPVPAVPAGANGGYVLNFSPVGHFETVAGEKLNLVLGSGIAVAGGLTYIEV